jgi:putative oxidoreductase
MHYSKKINVTLWVLQGLLALFFGLASGAPKLFLPLDMIPMPIPLAEPFLRFIGVCEVLGALGLILPGLTRIRPGLTPLAGACLVLLTICAAVYQLAAGQPANAVMALVIGLLAAVVAYGRWRLAPLSSQRQRGRSLEADQTQRSAGTAGAPTHSR